MKHSISVFSLGMLMGGVALFATVAIAWTGPTAAPPSGNVAAPINVGSTNQVKNGGLSVNAFSAFGSSYFAGKVGIGTLSPVTVLDVNGPVRVSNQPQYGPVTLESWGLMNTSGYGNIYMEPKPGSVFYIVPTDWSQNLTTFINGDVIASQAKSLIVRARANFPFQGTFNNTGVCSSQPVDFNTYAVCQAAFDELCGMKGYVGGTSIDTDGTGMEGFCFRKGALYIDEILL